MRAKIYFVRHGNAAPAEEDQHDTERKLTEKGRKQARERKLALGSPRFDLVYASPTARTYETAALIAGSGYTRAIVDLGELCPVGTADAHAFDKAFAMFGYAPLSTYMDVEQYGPIVTRLAGFAWSAIKAPLHQLGDVRILVAGHAVLLPAIGLVANAMRHGSICSKLLAANLEECGGFILTFDDSDLPFLIETFAV